MRVINNIATTHFDELKGLSKNADELYIISPFLTESFDDIFNEIITPAGIKGIVLITTLKDNDPDLFKKARSLRSIMANCSAKNIDFRLHIDNKLHGKIYITTIRGIPVNGIISSANFTGRGLRQNHEWGVCIDDSVELQKIIDDILRLSSLSIDSVELDSILTKIEDYALNRGIPGTPNIDLKINNLIRRSGFKPGLRYFIKPVGYLQRPFEITRRLSRDIEKMHFSGNPKSVRIGDILICYGVGTTKLLGYFEVTSSPYIWDSTSRWKWEVTAKNLCPDYSDSWVQFNNTIASIRRSFDPDAVINTNGGKTLGALRRGVDKIQLTEGFAKHVIEIIDNSI